MVGIYVGATDSKAEIFVEECMNVTHSIMAKNEEVVYILKGDIFKDIPENDGIKCIILDTEDTMSEMVKIIMENDISALIVDSSAISADDIASLSVYAKIIAFDEDKLPQNLFCIVNSNPFVGWNDYILNYCNGDTRLFLGGDFAPVSSDFAGIQPKNVEKDDLVEDILVYTGRYDRYGVGYTLLSKMAAMPEFDGYRIHTIIGAGYNSSESFYELQKKTNGKIIVHSKDDNIAEIISSCDIAVSAGGLQLMELAACGIPSVIYSTIEEQSELVRQMIVKEYAVGVGDIWVSIELKVENIIENIFKLISDGKKRKSLSDNIKTLTDGKGTERITNAIIG